MEPVYLEKTDIGATLTTWVYCSFWMMHSAEKLGLQGYINWPRDHMRALEPYFDDTAFDHNPNMYEWYFQQPLFQSAPPKGKVWTWENCPETGTEPLASKPLGYIRDYYKKHLRFSADVEVRGRALAAKYGIDFANTIGVTWRGTDCRTDGRAVNPIEVYFPFIDRFLERSPSARIACTAEEEGVLDKLMARYPQAFKITEFLSSPAGSLHNPERFTPLSGYERGMQPALMVWLFSKLAYYVKNRSSVAAVASWISDGDIVSISHSETLSYEKLNDIAEYKGERVPLIA